MTYFVIGFVENQILFISAMNILHMLQLVSYLCLTMSLQLWYTTTSEEAKIEVPISYFTYVEYAAFFMG